MDKWGGENAPASVAQALDQDSPDEATGEDANEAKEEEIRAADNAVFQTRVDELKEQKAEVAETAASLTAELEELSSAESSVAGLRHKNEVLTKDVQQFEKLVEKLQGHKGALEEKLAARRDEIADIGEWRVWGVCVWGVLSLPAPL